MKASLGILVALFIGASVAGGVGFSLGYKVAIEDSAAISSFTDAGVGYAHLHILNEKGSGELQRFLVNDIPLTVSIHRYAVDEQSFMSSIRGPISEMKQNPQHFIGYYSRISEELSPLVESERDRAALQSNIAWLLRHPALATEAQP